MKLERLKEELSDKLKTVGKVGRALGYGAFLGLVAYTAGCSTAVKQPEVVLREGMPNTLTYSDNGTQKTIWDLSGLWDGHYAGPVQDIKINQKGTSITAVTLTGDSFRSPGMIAFKGYIEGSKFYGEQQFCGSGGGCFYMPAEGDIKSEGRILELFVSSFEGISTNRHVTFTKKPTRSSSN